MEINLEKICKYAIDSFDVDDDKVVCCNFKDYCADKTESRVLALTYMDNYNKTYSAKHCCRRWLERYEDTKDKLPTL